MFKNIYEVITLFQYFNIIIFFSLLVGLYFYLKKNILFLILIFFVLSETITIFNKSIVDEISLSILIIYYFFKKKEEIINFFINEKKIYLYFAILLNLYLLLNVFFEFLDTGDIRLFRFTYLYLTITSLIFLSIFFHKGLESTKLTKNNFIILFYLISICFIYLMLKAEILDSYQLYGRTLDQGKTWSGTARSSLILVLFSLVSSQCYNFSKNNYKLYYIIFCIFLSLFWSIYFDTRSGTIFSFLGFIYLFLSTNNFRHKIISLLIFIITFVGLTIKGDKKNLHADYLKTNLKHNFSINVFYDQNFETDLKIFNIDKMQSMSDEMRKKMREKNYFTVTSNLSRLAQYKSFYSYLNDSDIVEIIFGNGAYSHRTILVPYINKYYKQFKIKQLEEYSYPKGMRNDTSEIKIFRTNSFIGIVVDYGIVGLLIFTSIVILPLIYFIKKKPLSVYLYVNASDSLLLLSFYYFINFLRVKKS